jgi:muramoyltetrapeptide carboxypeptidase
MRYPPFLRPGDRVGVVAPASAVSIEELRPGLAILREKWGLDVVEGATLHLSHHQFAGTDTQRLHDLQSMLDDPTLSAIFMARGGYGCSRIIEQLDFSGFLRSPKWLVGYSDITLLLLHAYRLGVVSVHGDMVKLLGRDGKEHAIESLYNTLFGCSIQYTIQTHPFNRLGSAKALLVGGNLSLLAHSLGSSSEPDTHDKILFLEDVGEYLHNLDRMMIQLKRAGKLTHLKGLIVGQFTEVKDNPEPSHFGQTANEIIAQHVSELSFPVCFDFPTGHITDNRALGVGFEATLVIEPEKVFLTY